MKPEVPSFLNTLHRGEVSFGLWLTLVSPLSADIAAGSALDWALIDGEHSPAGIGEILQQLRALEGSTVAPVVRTSSNDPVTIKKLLDIGAHALMIPMVESAEAASRAVLATRYPPGGVRGVASVVRAGNFGRRQDYASRIHEEICVILQLESVQSLRCFDEIARVDGVDAVFIGPSDLAASAGFIGRPDEARVRSLIEDAVRRAKARDLPIGTLAGPRQPVADCVAMGFDFVAIGSDTGLLREALDGTLARLTA